MCVCVRVCMCMYERGGGGRCALMRAQQKVAVTESRYFARKKISDSFHYSLTPSPAHRSCLLSFFFFLYRYLAGVKDDIPRRGAHVKGRALSENEIIGTERYRIDRQVTRLTERLCREWSVR